MIMMHWPLKTCPKCGLEIYKKSTKVCPNCGHEFNKKFNKFILIVVIAIVAINLLFCAAMLLFSML